MLLEDVQLPVFVGIAVVHPSAGRFCIRIAVGCVALVATHLIAHRQYNGCCGKNRSLGVPGHNLRHRIGLGASLIVIRDGRNTVGRPVCVGAIVLQAAGREALRAVARQAYIGWVVIAEQDVDVAPEVRFGGADGVDRPGRVGHGLIRDRDAARNGYRRLARLDQLRMHHVVGRQYREYRVVLAVHTVHSEFAPRHQTVFRGLCLRRGAGRSARDPAEGHNGKPCHHHPKRLTFLHTVLHVPNGPVSTECGAALRTSKARSIKRVANCVCGRETERPSRVELP